ncbi:hypothetical protein NDU88_002799 [Pleurodeles waltl]|uniref:Uncharacterized protein n=1 Tax=Pleurodeles waltl TaxID=8319 RepID=A0AAV7KWG5_PLEWA|nr:hypothetical protein NDU88_002799 [Pleurodeles waltl]
MLEAAALVPGAAACEKQGEASPEPILCLPGRSGDPLGHCTCCRVPRDTERRASAHLYLLECPGAKNTALFNALE